jgi:hypothetical protein
MFGFGMPKAPAKPVVLLAGVPDPVSDPRPCIPSHQVFGCRGRSAGKEVAKRAVGDEGGGGAKGRDGLFGVASPRDSLARACAGRWFHRATFRDDCVAACRRRTALQSPNPPSPLFPADARSHPHLGRWSVSVAGNGGGLVAPAAAIMPLPIAKRRKACTSEGCVMTTHLALWCACAAGFSLWRLGGRCRVGRLFPSFCSAAAMRNSADVAGCRADHWKEDAFDALVPPGGHPPSRPSPPTTFTSPPCSRRSPLPMFSMTSDE